MNVHEIYAQIFRVWRSKRMALFEQILHPRSDEVVLDVGGRPGTWTSQPQRVRRIDCIDPQPLVWDADSAPDHDITVSKGDGCDLEYEDRHYDIVFSNSVIEHVGDLDRQRLFANEVRRVGTRLWIQTPAYECPIEPHYLALFVHWLPAKAQRRVLRWFTPWGWLAKPTREQVDDSVAHTRLLTKKQVQELFPDCEVLTERLLWIIPKSYVAYRTGP